MRISSGNLRGQAIERPKTRSVRPMSGKVRAALFDVVGNVTGWHVLDAYAGSGMVGFEAASRGAAQVDAIEASLAVARSITASARQLNLNDYRLATSKVESWLVQPDNNGKRYDMIVADPPYTQLNPRVLEQLGGRLTPDGILVVSHDSKLTAPSLNGLELARSKIYGDSALSFYKRRSL